MTALLLLMLLLLFNSSAAVTGRGCVACAGLSSVGRQRAPSLHHSRSLRHPPAARLQQQRHQSHRLLLPQRELQSQTPRRHFQLFSASPLRACLPVVLLFPRVVTYRPCPRFVVRQLFHIFSPLLPSPFPVRCPALPAPAQLRRPARLFGHLFCLFSAISSCFRRVPAASPALSRSRSPSVRLGRASPAVLERRQRLMGHCSATSETWAT